MAVLFGCIPEIVVRDIDTVTRFLIDVVGFEVRTDECRAHVQAILVNGDIQIHVFSADKDPNLRSYITGLVFRCDDCKYWHDRLESNGLAPALVDKADYPLSAGCHVTDDFAVTFEEIGPRGDKPVEHPT